MKKNEKDFTDTNKIKYLINFFYKIKQYVTNCLFKSNFIVNKEIDKYGQIMRCLS